MLDLIVEGMTCDHCVRAVSEAVSAMPGVHGVTVSLANGTVHVEGDPAPAAVRAAIVAEGYTVR